MIKLSDFNHDTGEYASLQIRLDCMAYVKPGTISTPDLSRVRVTKTTCKMYRRFANQWEPYTESKTVKEMLKWCEVHGLKPVRARMNANLIECYICLMVRPIN